MAGIIKIMLTCAISVLLATPSAAQVQVYRTTDAAGNVIFTDVNPRDGKAESIEISPILIIPAARVKPSQKKNNAAKNSSYELLLILTPEDQQTFQNPKSVSITARSKPEPHSGHRFRLLVDSKNTLESDSPAFTLEQPNRGAHALQVQIIDSRGKVLKSSATRTIFVLRPSALLRKKPQPGEANILPVL